jgi:hypothetical protein
MAENSKIKRVKIKTQKVSYEVMKFWLQRESYAKVVTRPARSAIFICFYLVLGCHHKRLK